LRQREKKKEGNKGDKKETGTMDGSAREVVGAKI
jgi:hypothetical protein